MQLIPTWKDMDKLMVIFEELCYSVARKKILNGFIYFFFFYEKDPADAQRAALMALLKYILDEESEPQLWYSECCSRWIGEGGRG